MRPQISFSEDQLFRNFCQWRWKLEYLDGHRRKDFGIHLDFGTAVHEAIEKHRTRKDPVSIASAIVHFEKRFQELWDKNHARYKAKEQEINHEDFLVAGRRILEHFHECRELAEAEVVFNEFKLDVPIDRSDGVAIKFKGYIDMVIKTKDKRGTTVLYVVDFKTCSWGWNRDKRQDRDLQAQLFLYKHFLCKRFDLDPKQVRVAFVLLKKRPRLNDSVIEFLPVSAGPISVQRALNVLNQDITEMRERSESGTLIKNLKSCVNQYGDVCPFYATTLCLKD